MNIVFDDHSDEVLAKASQALEQALETIGLVAEGYAKKLCPVDTGNLRNSISHTVSGDAVYIGTNAEYAVYVELGTGKYYPGGRDSPWAFKDSKGRWHKTSGIKAQPYLKPAVTEHKSTYKGIIEKAYKGNS